LIYEMFALASYRYQSINVTWTIIKNSIYPFARPECTSFPRMNTKDPKMIIVLESL